MKNPTAGELAVLRERAERTFSRFPVLPRREDGRMSPESRLRFELTMETILEKNRARASCCAAHPGRTKRFASARRACWSASP